MTKAIRIENADNSVHKVRVRVMRRGTPGEADVEVERQEINHPTAMLQKTIWKEQYLIVEEVD